MALLVAVATLFVAVGFALLAMEDPGYVVLARAPYAVRLPLALFLLAVAGGFGGVYLALAFIGGLWRAPAKMRAWRQRRRQARAQRNTILGYAGLIEGHWGRAEQKLLSHLQHHQTPLMNYLGAAYAAQQQGALRRRDRYLADALAHHPEQRLAIGLTAARLHWHVGEVYEARAVLEKLLRAAPGNVAALRLLADAHRHQGDWAAAVALLPALARHGVFAAEEWAARCSRIYAGYFAAAARAGGLQAAFEALPSAHKKTPQAVAGMSRQLLRAGRHLSAEKIIRQALNRGWHAELAYLYGQAETAFTADQIMLAESWQRSYGAHVDLTLTLARLHRRDSRSAQAQELFAQAIAAGGGAQVYAELGALLEEKGDAAAAQACYRRGLAPRAALADGGAGDAAAGGEFSGGEANQDEPAWELLARDGRRMAGDSAVDGVMPVV